MTVKQLDSEGYRPVKKIVNPGKPGIKEILYLSKEILNSVTLEIEKKIYVTWRRNESKQFATPINLSDFLVG